MLVPFRPLRAASAALVAAAMLLQGCGGGGGSTTPKPIISGTVVPTASPGPGALATPVSQPAGSSLTGGTVAGTLSLPAGSKLAVTSLTVTNSLGSTGPGTGSFTLPAFTNGPQVAIAANAAGAPVLAGFLSAAEPQLNAHTTAEYLAYYAAGFFLLSPALAQQAYAAMVSNSAFAAVEAAVTADIVANPGTFTAMGPALKNFVTSVGAGTAAIKRRPAQRRGARDLLVDPSNGQSGVTVLNLDALQIAFANEQRRPSLAYIDQVSYGMASGTSTKIVAAPVTDVIPPVNTGDTATDLFRIMGECGNFSNCIPATTSLKTVTGTLTDLLYGNSAFAPIQTGAVTLQPFSGSLWTRYQVTVVGPGAHAGVPLTTEQSDGQRDVSLIFLFQDLFMPWLTSFLLPNVTDVPALIGSMTPAQVIALNEAIKLLLVSLPAIETDARSGNMPGAFALAIGAIVDNQQIRDAFLSVLVDVAKAKVPNSAVIEELSGALTRATGAADAFLLGFNTSVTLNNLFAANQGDQYTVVVVPVTITLTPTTNNLNNDGSVHLTTNVLISGESDLNLTYAWTNTAQFGHFKDLAVPPDTDNFSSTTQDEGIYTAVHTGTGTDTVTVTVGAIDSSGNKIERYVLGTASATIKVAPNPLGNPPGGLDQSRCAGMAFSQHDFHVGDTVSGTTSGFNVNNCGGNLTNPPTAPTWTWPLGAGTAVVSGCGPSAATCAFRVTAPTGVYQILCLAGNSVQGPWDSCDYYGVLP